MKIPDAHVTKESCNRGEREREREREREGEREREEEEVRDMSK